MRIGIDVRVVDPPEGQQRMLWQLGAWLGAQGHEVEFLSVRAQPDEVTLPYGTSLRRLHDVPRPQLKGRVRDLALDAFLINPER